MEAQAKYKVKTETQLVPYNLEAATVNALKSKYLDVTIQPDDKSAYAMVMSGLRECREIRLAVDTWHKERKEWIVKAGKHYDTERRRVHALVEPVEEHLTAVRKVEDDRKEAIRAEAERIERERVEKVRAKIENMKKIPSRITPLTPLSEIEEVYKALLNWEPVSESNYQEFTHEAIAIYNDTVSAVLKIKEDRQKWEQEQAAAKAESKRLDKIRQEQEVEAKRLEAIRKAEEEKYRLEREYLEAERRKIASDKAVLEAEKRAEQERLERVEFERKTQEEAKVRAESEARKKVEREAKEGLERAEKEKVEKERQEALRPDKEKIITYITSLMKVPVPDIGTESARQLFETATAALKKWASKLIKQAEGL